MWPAPSAAPVAPPPPVLVESVAGRRVAAAFLDLMPLTVVVAALSDRVDSDDQFMIRLSGWRFIVALAAVLGYYFVAETLTATSPGKRLLGLVVVDTNGGRPSWRAVAARTAMRLVDGLPVLYLVGFIVMLASPSKQRVGDMVASTRVVRSATAGDPAGVRSRSATSTLLLVLLVLVTLAAGIASLASRGDDTSSNEAVGAFDFDADVVPYIDDTIERVFRDLSDEALMDLFAPGAATPAEATKAIDQLEQYAGRLVGDYEIDQHRVTNDRRVAELDDSFDIVEVEVVADFENGPGRLLVAIGDVDGELKLLSWNVGLSD